MSVPQRPPVGSKRARGRHSPRSDAHPPCDRWPREAHASKGARRVARRTHVQSVRPRSLPPRSLLGRKAMRRRTTRGSKSFPPPRGESPCEQCVAPPHSPHPPPVRHATQGFVLAPFRRESRLSRACRCGRSSPSTVMNPCRASRSGSPSRTCRWRSTTSSSR